MCDESILGPVCLQVNHALYSCLVDELLEDLVNGGDELLACHRLQSRVISGVMTHPKPTRNHLGVEYVAHFNRDVLVSTLSFNLTYLVQTKSESSSRTTTTLNSPQIQFVDASSPPLHYYAASIVNPSCSFLKRAFLDWNPLIHTECLECSPLSAFVRFFPVLNRCPDIFCQFGRHFSSTAHIDKVLISLPRRSQSSEH